MENKELKGYEYLENCSDTELIELAKELEQDCISDDSVIRKLAKDFFGGSSLTQIIAVSHPILKVVSARMKRYSPHI